MKKRRSPGCSTKVSKPKGTVNPLAKYRPLLIGLPPKLRMDLLRRLEPLEKGFGIFRGRGDEKGMAAIRGAIELAVQEWQRDRFPGALARWLAGTLGSGGPIEEASRAMYDRGPSGHPAAQEIYRLGDAHAREIRRFWRTTSPIPQAPDPVVGVRQLIDWCRDVAPCVNRCIQQAKTGKAAPPAASKVKEPAPSTAEGNWSRPMPLTAISDRILRNPRQSHKVRSVYKDRLIQIGGKGSKSWQIRLDGLAENIRKDLERP